MDPFDRWLQALEERHLGALNFQETRRAVQALSTLYVERRDRIGSSRLFEGAGKRAAFAWYFAPLHFLLVREIVRALGASAPAPDVILDLGCGTGGGGAAWASEAGRSKVIGVDCNPWAAQEARWTYSIFNLPGKARIADIETLMIPLGAAVLSAFTLNELAPDARDRARAGLTQAIKRGQAVLIVEPIARRVTPWWDDWAREWSALGARENQWRFPVQLPERLALMDKAAGLDHRELTGRSLWSPSNQGNFSERRRLKANTFPV